MSSSIEDENIVGNVGILGAIVWPPYVGVTHDDPGAAGCTAQHEPYDDINYSRALIMWRTDADGRVLGRAQIFAPKGVFTYIAYFNGPQRDAVLMGPGVRLEQPLVFDRPGVVELDPIENQDYLPRPSA